MDGTVVLRNIGMARGSVLRIEDGLGVEVGAQVGRLWLTQDGDARDYFVGAGDSFVIDRGGLALIHALRGSVVTLTAPSAELYADRVVLVPFGAAVPQVLYASAGDPVPPMLRLRRRFMRWWTGLYAAHPRTTTAAL